MAKNYQKCLSYLDFENSDFYFTEEQKEEIIQKFDMYFVLSSTEYQMEQISKALLRLDSDENIWKMLGLRIRHISKPRNPPHINKLLRMPPDFDLTVIFKDSLKYQLEDLNDVCRKSKYSIYPYPENPHHHYTDYNDYANLPEEIKKNRKLSYKPAPPEYAEMQRRKNKDTMDRMRSHFIDAERKTYVPISEDRLDVAIIKKDQEEQRKNKLFECAKSVENIRYYNKRKDIIDNIINNSKKATPDIITRMVSKDIHDQTIYYIAEVFDRSHLTADIIYVLLTPKLSMNILHKLVQIICNKDFDIIRSTNIIRKFVDYCVKYSIMDITLDKMSDINKFTSVCEIYMYNEEYTRYLIQNIDYITSTKMINSMKKMSIICSAHPSTIINILSICDIIKSTCADRDRIVYNALIANENGVSIYDIEYGIKHCSDSGAKMWLMMRMAEHGLPLDNSDIDHVVFDSSIEYMMKVMYRDDYPIEMILEMIEGLVNHYGIRHRYYTISEISSYFDTYIKILNANLIDYVEKYNMKSINFTKYHKYAHTIHYIKADGKFNGKINSSQIHGRYFYGSFKDMNNILSGRELKYHITPEDSLY